MTVLLLDLMIAGVVPQWVVWVDLATCLLAQAQDTMTVGCLQVLLERPWDNLCVVVGLGEVVVHLPRMTAVAVGLQEMWDPLVATEVAADTMVSVEAPLLLDLPDLPEVGDTEHTKDNKTAGT